MTDFNLLAEKAKWIRRKTLEVHQIAPETRVASSLSCVEIFAVLYYGQILKYNSKDIFWSDRDRVIISKGHGAISLYPVLADLGFFEMGELDRVCKKDSFLGAIPDVIIPGFETTNGSLGNGLGVACGMALALKRRKRNEKVFVMLGDGELNEGAVWEALMFAGEHNLSNLIAIVDHNKIAMLDYCENIIDMRPLERKFEVFNWNVEKADGHDIRQLHSVFEGFLEQNNDSPKMLIADTVKGKGVPSLEGDSLCHIRSLDANAMISAINGL